MPRFMAMTKHESRARYDFPYQPLVDKLPARLVPPSEKSVRRAADTQFLFRGEIQHAERIFAVKPERFFAVDVFPGLESALVYFRMRGRYRQVQHRVYSGVGEKFVHPIAFKPNFPAQASAASGRKSAQAVICICLNVGAFFKYAPLMLPQPIKPTFISEPFLLALMP